MTTNALFFNDSTMHKIYKDNGKFNLEYQIPQIVYSTLIVSGINTIINYFALTENDIISLKSIESTDVVERKKNLLFIKFIYILLFAFYYYYFFLFIYAVFVLYMKILKYI